MSESKTVCVERGVVGRGRLLGIAKTREARRSAPPGDMRAEDIAENSSSAEPWNGGYLF